MVLSVIILTLNEEKNIEKCINSIKLIASEIIVIDSYSTDNTVIIAENLGAVVYKNKWINYSNQFNFGLTMVNNKTKWILRLDADEEFTPDAVRDLKILIDKNNDTDINGIVIRFKVFFLGKFLKYGGNYPFKKLLVFKHNIGYIENKNMDEHILLKFGRIVELKQDCLHHDFKNITTFIDTHNKYSSREIQDYEISKSPQNYESNSKFDEKKDNKVRYLRVKFYYKLPMFLRSYLYFLFRYIFLLGFLDGTEGFIYLYLQAYWYRFLVDTKIYESKKSK
jgi:glycosyltransferase involved in cell wall biosynthesis